MELPTGPLTLESLLFALSVTQTRPKQFQPAVIASAEERRSQAKHLSLLDHIALLLVTEERGDVVAVGFRMPRPPPPHMPQIVRFWFMRNRPSTTAQAQHVESIVTLLSSANQGRGIVECVNDFAKLVYANCGPQIRRRFRKLRTAWREIPASDRPSWPTLPANVLEKLNRTLSDRDRRLEQGWGAFLNGWFEETINADFPGGYDDVAKMLNTAYCVGWDETLLGALVVPKLQRRVRKLGQYFRAMTYLVFSAAQQKKGTSFQILEVRLMSIVRDRIGCPV